MSDYSTIPVFACAFVVAAVGGLAALLRSTTPLTRKNVFAYIVNSGVLGLGISLLWYDKFVDNIYFLHGCCVIAGLGGMASVDFVVDIFKQVFSRLGEKK